MPDGFRGDVAYYWNMVVKSPLQSIGALLAFLGSSSSLLEMFFDKGRRRRDERDRQYSGAFDRTTVGALAGLRDRDLLDWLDNLADHRFAFQIEGGGSRSKEEGWRLVGLVLSCLFGLFLTFLSLHLLVDMGMKTSGGRNLPDGLVFMLTVAGLAVAVALMKTSYRLTFDADLLVIDRCATFLLVFTLSATVSAIIVFLMMG
ncbi:hypothetical protein [Breoghania sp.]|uniref:hypothetical protein n=1 Tax=Breoghania sp. TaxID=2065378 RepID=UPI002618FB74|nr:hypothetical protein [Breoghania sp.]MDJ0930653.1 hypothetical protein [Breoghania sp.]